MNSVLLTWQFAFLSAGTALACLSAPSASSSSSFPVVAVTLVACGAWTSCCALLLALQEGGTITPDPDPASSPRPSCINQFLPLPHLLQLPACHEHDSRVVMSPASPLHLIGALVGIVWSACALGACLAPMMGAMPEMDGRNGMAC